MTEPSQPRSALPLALVQLAAIVLLGLVVLPVLLAGESANPRTLTGVTSLTQVAWLAGAVLAVLWLVPVASMLGRAIARALASVGSRPAERSARPTWVGSDPALARWLVIGGYELLAAAILRRPLVTALGQVLDPPGVESVFVASLLALFFVVLFRVHQAARPLVETAAWYTLDSLLPTTGSEAAGQAFAAAGTPTTGTVTATRLAPTVADEATVPAATETPAPAWDSQGVQPKLSTEAEATEPDATVARQTHQAA